MTVETISLDQFHDRIKNQGAARIEDVEFICPMCKHHQTGQDLIDAGAGSNMNEIERYLAFSCVGRWTGAGQFDESAGGPCDWTLGGLFSIHKLVVVDPDGKEFPRFEVAPPFADRDPARPGTS